MKKIRLLLLVMAAFGFMALYSCNGAGGNAQDGDKDSVAVGEEPKIEEVVPDSANVAVVDSVVTAAVDSAVVEATK